MRKLKLGLEIPFCPDEFLYYLDQNTGAVVAHVAASCGQHFIAQCHEGSDSFCCLFGLERTEQVHDGISNPYPSGCCQLLDSMRPEIWRKQGLEMRVVYLSGQDIIQYLDEFVVIFVVVEMMSGQDASPVACMLP